MKNADIATSHNSKFILLFRKFEFLFVIKKRVLLIAGVDP